jgi:hypothetical protein
MEKSISTVGIKQNKVSFFFLLQATQYSSHFFFRASTTPTQHFSATVT